MPKVDAFRDTLKVIDLDGLKQVNRQIIKKAVENKVLITEPLMDILWLRSMEPNSSEAIRKAVQNV
ncbi:hypothetical protein [Desulfosporosinus lacus]|uniref:Uncharacterized protein n=1 Tax=Desulfosporosinus lacus DSM 15449 TaxID=1121420 RepID=A0A1M5ZY56_9FIRM|nr:hypothetical protein [Desulfosporosinus lacus]SHI29170.1 hypothetical protein SAMN02746098_03810 [Desulfosporosinus lacus DSM 15449]